MNPGLSGLTVPEFHGPRDMDNFPRDVDDNGRRQVTHSGRRGPCCTASSVFELLGPIPSSFCIEVALPAPQTSQPQRKAEDSNNFLP